MQLLMSVASGRGMRTKRPSAKALEADQDSEEDVSQVAELEGMPSTRLSQLQPRLQLQLRPLTAAVLSSAERGKRFLEKLKLEAKADPDGQHPEAHSTHDASRSGAPAGGGFASRARRR